jgi:ComF family protein
MDISKPLQFLKTIIAPAFCPYCRKFLDQETVFCQACFLQIVPVSTTSLEITKKYQATVYSLGKYQNRVRALITAKQYGNRQASEQLGRLIWDYTDVRYAQFDCIVPIPLHWTRLAWRWFNQAETIANELSKRSNKPVLKLLKRIQKTEFQAEKTREQRFENVQNVFSLTGIPLPSSSASILVVDDVMTTGATLHAALRCLLPLKPAKLLVAVAARVL